ncbi:MAG: helix-hairpin-helix domain-containing protein [Bacteroidetes bacterium]|nr:helix-hairpin-helix domain-containing protein [Bacteroidota bacterium]MBS1630843.1 helix-hairpin-helix domain-containing protein [Bacteroidota bacterium]
MNQTAILKALQVIPGIGKACAQDLFLMGIRRVEDLRGRNPRALYELLNERTGQRHDPCMLYTFRCAVYFATEQQHEPEKLQWWYWKDKPYREEES